MKPSPSEAAVPTERLSGPMIGTPRCWESPPRQAAASMPRADSADLCREPEREVKPYYVMDRPPQANQGRAQGHRSTMTPEPRRPPARSSMDQGPSQEAQHMLLQLGFRVHPMPPPPQFHYYYPGHLTAFGGMVFPSECTLPPVREHDEHSEYSPFASAPRGSGGPRERGKPKRG
ncbi:hypothetical protein BC939DRAFT_469941 [Gamsiella multidivaricata]|uniref:uncharacterized protein n=1 Tax=Gamsiella multidivaricata TaxID=101098 RepID=UPI00221EE3DB|nr:uncharacterized protein BC939DRAFT_469941 [Gamsiella multidivaricata]KAI7816201.1 hypothetical protein BC939DRAFT_469941 [Gamsiella multidivaricata]